MSQKRKSRPKREPAALADLYVAEPPFARVKEAWHDAAENKSEVGRLTITAWLLAYRAVLELRDRVRRRRGARPSS
jgi:hypothetical protein